MQAKYMKKRYTASYLRVGMIKSLILITVINLFDFILYFLYVMSTFRLKKTMPWPYHCS